MAFAKVSFRVAGDARYARGFEAAAMEVRDMREPFTAIGQIILRNIFEQRKDKTMFIIGAGTLRYKDIMEVIDAAKGVGVDKVGIVTEGMRRAGGATTGSN